MNRCDAAIHVKLAELDRRAERLMDAFAESEDLPAPFPPHRRPATAPCSHRCGVLPAALRPDPAIHGG